MSIAKEKLKLISEQILKQILESEAFQTMEGIPAPIKMLVPLMTRSLPDYLSKAIDTLDEALVIEKINYIDKEVIPWLLSEPTSESQ